MTPKQANDMVDSLWEAVNHGGAALADVPRIIKDILVTGAWRERRIRTGDIVKHDKFYDFITKKPLEGCGWQPDQILSLIDKDVETLALWREAMTGKKGKRVKDNSDNVTIINHAERGNTRSYTVSRLKKQRPDLFDQVKDGKMSANAAAIEAGFRKKKTPLQNLRLAWLKANASEREQFLSEISCL